MDEGNVMQNMASTWWAFPLWRAASLALLEKGAFVLSLSLSAMVTVHGMGPNFF